MNLHKGYETIDMDWDKFYEFPDRYDRFSLHSVGAINVMRGLIPLNGKRILDVASGTGLSTFALADFASEVVGVEPSAEMRQVARQTQHRRGVDNVKFVDQAGEMMEFQPSSFDAAVSVMAFPWTHSESDRTAGLEFVRRSELAVRKGGYICSVLFTKGMNFQHQRGNREPLIAPNERPGGKVFRYMTPLGFHYKDAVVTTHYASIEEALATYGFIYGPDAIDYILDNRSTQFEWSLRFYIKKVI